MRWALAANPSLVIRVAASLAELKQNLKEGKDQIETTTAAMGKLSTSLQGDRLIQNAHNIVAAVNQLGGAAKLTESEKARLNATLSKAIEKYQALGKEAPAAMVQLRDATKAADAATTNATTAAFNWKSALIGVAGALGVAFSLNVLKNFTIDVIQAGAQIGDLAQKLGVSTEAVQRWTYAAEQSGATFENVDKSVAIMNRTLSEGSKGTIAILARAGLEFDNIRKMRPEDAFNAITEAIAGIEDPMLRAEVATKLFGKAGQELLPAIVDGFVKVGKEARVMSDETIQRLKAAEDAWGRLKHTVTIHSGEIIASVFKVTTSWKEMAASLATALIPGEFGRKMQADIVDTLDSLTGTTIDLTKTLSAVPPAAAKVVSAGLKPVAIASTEVESTVKRLTADLHLSTAALGLVEPKLGTLAQFMRSAAKENEIWNSGLRFTSEVVADLPQKLDKVAESIKKVEVAETAAAAASKFAPGSVQINTAGIAFHNVDAAFKQFRQRYHQGGVGAIGGGPAEDFLSWALRWGLATRGNPEARANGGPVSAGRPYLVGERGPEMFMPRTSGTVIPSGGGWNVSVPVTINGSVLSNPHEIARVVGDAVMQAMRNQGGRMPVGA